MIPPMDMHREKIVIPMVKKKLGSNAERAKGKFLNSIEATQFAVEQLSKRVVALEKQCDGLARLLKEQDIRNNKRGLEIRRLRQRLERGDGE